MWARVFREVALAAARASRALATPRYLIGLVTLVSAMALLSFGAAQAQIATTTQLISAPNPSVAGEPATFTATVVPATPGAQTPSGTVTFLDGGTPIGTGTLTPNGTESVAVFLTGTLSVGTHTITSSYPGDANFGGSNGGPLLQIVNKNGANTEILPSPNPSTIGQNVSFDIVLSPATGTISSVFPTGTVTVFDNGIQIGTVTLSSIGENSHGVLTTTTLTAGSHAITTSYPGDANFNGSTGSVSQVVNKATPATTGLASSLNPSTFGQSVTFTATVTGSGGVTPTGTVTFIDQTNNQVLGTINLIAAGNNSAEAVLMTSALTAGSHSILATYSGDPNFNASTASLAQTVNKVATSTGLVSSLNPSVSGQSVTFTATVSSTGGTPTGSITFTDQTTNQTLGTVQLANRQAVLTISTLAPGTHMIQASYSGDTNFAASSTTLSQTVNKAAVTLSLVSSANPSQAGQSVTFTATVTGNAAGGATPTGSVTFVIGGNSTSVPLSGITASISTTTLPTGSDTITANYSGDPNFSSASQSITQTVNKNNSSTTLESNDNPSNFGQTVTLSALVQGSLLLPTGTVTFVDTTTGTTLGTATIHGTSLQNNFATLSIATLTAGTHNITYHLQRRRQFQHQHRHAVATGQQGQHEHSTHVIGAEWQRGRPVGDLHGHCLRRRAGKGNADR
jgi:large repetitive protein